MRHTLQIWECLPFGSLPRTGQTPARPHTCSQVRAPRGIEVARVNSLNHNCTVFLPPPSPQEKTCQKQRTPPVSWRQIPMRTHNRAPRLQKERSTCFPFCFQKEENFCGSSFTPANQTQKHLPLQLENTSVSAFLNSGSLLKLFKQHWATRTGHQHIGAERGQKRKIDCT